MTSRIACLIGVFVVNASVFAASVTGWQPGPGVEQKDGALTLAIPDDAQVGDLLQSLQSPLQLEPGVYRIQATVQAEPLQNMAYRLVLTVRDVNSKAKVSRNPMDQLTPRPREAWVAVAEKRAFQHDDKGQVHLEVIFAVPEAGDYQVSVGWKMGADHVNIYRRSKTSTPVSLERMTLNKIDIEKLERLIDVEILTADKILYKPGMAPTLTAKVVNTASHTQPLVWQVRQSRDVDAPQVVAKGTYDAPSGASEWSINLPTLNEFGGYRYDLDISTPEGRHLQSIDRCVVCSSQYNRIGMGGFATHRSPMIHGNSANWTPEQIRAGLDSMRDAYLCWREINFWAPCDFQELTPEENLFLSTVGRPQSTEMLKLFNEEARKRGIGIFSYVKGSYVSGWAGFDWARQNPELLFYHRDTGRPMGNYNMEMIYTWEERTRKHFEEKKKAGSSWDNIVLNSGRPSVVDIAVAEQAASVAMFGWAGARFDGDFEITPSDLWNSGPVRDFQGDHVAHAKDAEIAYADAVRRYKRKMREVLPDFEFGFNHAFDDSHQEWIVTPVMASGGAMIMNEPVRGFGGSPQRAYNKWIDYADMMAHYSRIIRSWGGFLMPIGCYGMRADDYLYQSVYTLAAQAKPCGPYFFNSALTEQFPRFITRYAGILCADWYAVPAPEGRMSVDAPASLEWQRYVNYMEPESGRQRDYVLQFVNPPVPERANGEDDRCLLREPVENVTVTFDLDPYETPQKAWLLDPWNPDDQTPIELTPTANGVQFTLPRAVAIWSVVVLRCDLSLDRPFADEALE